KEGYFVLSWDVSSAKEVLRFGGLTDKIKSVAFSPDGRVLAAASQDGRIALWDAESARERLFIVAHPRQGEAVFGTSPGIAFAPDGKRLVSASSDQTLRVWDATTGREQKQFRGDGGFAAVALAVDGKTAVTAGADGTTLVWDITLPPPAPRGTQHTISIR